MISDFQQEIATRKEIYRIQIKNISSKCSKLMLLLGILSQTIGFAAILILNILTTINISAINPLYYMNEEAINVVFGLFPCIFADIITIIIGLKITKMKFKKDFFSKEKYSKKIILLGMVSIGGLLFISSTIYGVYSFIIQSMGLTIPSPEFNLPSDNLMKWIYLFYVCLLGPILEETIFRGIILHSMKKYGAFTAIIFTSILFAMFHLNLVQFMTPVILGLLLGFVTVKANSIFPAIIIHIFNNTVATFISYLDSVNQIASGILSSIVIIGGIIGLLFFIKKYASDFKKLIISESKMLSFKNKFRYCFSSKWSKGYIAFYVVFIVITFIFENVAFK